MPKYDPKRGFIAQGVPEWPMGTVDELEDSRLPVDVFPSCHEQAEHRGIKGCPCAHLCTMSYKGKTLAEGGGPRNHGWEHIKSAAQGGNVVRVVASCHWGVSQQEAVEANGGILRPIKDEGQTIEILTGTLVPIPSDQFHREERLVPTVVQPAKRLKDNVGIAQNMLRASVAKEEAERIANERPAQILGVSTGGTPLDKRAPRSKG